ncbi:MAG: DUF5668 domain-containing protein [Candidatus Caldatribacteriota bacterium]|nr:DUF5668 domain-containing protein [Candidatus Caldatribacteriota bacterium]
MNEDNSWDRGDKIDEVKVYFEPKEHKENKYKNRKIKSGIMIILIGIIFLLSNFFPKLNWGNLWPLLLIAVGTSFVIDSFKKN